MISPCACQGGEARWGTLDLNEARKNFTSLEVTLVIPGTDTPLPGLKDIEVFDTKKEPNANGTIDLSGLDAQTYSQLEVRFNSITAPGIPKGPVEANLVITSRATLID